MIDEYNNHFDQEAAFAEKRQFIKMCRRAVVRHDEHARAWLQSTTQNLLQESLYNHPYYEELRCTGKTEQYVLLTFERFWQMVDQQKLWLNSRAQMLHHLQATLNCLILETLRTHTQQKEASCNTTTSSDAHTLWRILQEFLPGERERRVAYLLYHCGLKPTEIVRTCPQEFNDVQEIHRVRCTVIEKMWAYL